MIEFLSCKSRPIFRRRSETDTPRLSSTGIFASSLLTVLSRISNDFSFTKISAIRLYPFLISRRSSTWNFPWLWCKPSASITSWVKFAPVVTIASRNPRSIKSPMSNRKPDGTIGPASVRKFVKSGLRNISSTTSEAAPIRPPPRTPVALISRTRASALIPGQSRRCLTLEGFLLVMDCSALSTDNHVPSHNAPVLDFDSGSHLFLQVLIIRHRCLECLIILHVHHLEKISRDGENLSRSLVYEWDLGLAVNRADEVLLLACERAYRNDPCLCRAVLAGLGFLELYNPARFTINEDVLAYLHTANFDRLAHEITSRRRAVLGLHLKDFA